MKHLCRQLKAYTMRIEGYGTIGTYQRIIVISIWIIICGSFLSVVFNAFPQNSWMNLLCNYAIGITCSAIVLLVSTIIQFVSDRNRIANEFSVKVLILLTYLLEVVDGNISECVDNRNKRKLINDMITDCEKTGYSSLFWFNVDSFDIYLKVNQYILGLRTAFYSNHDMNIVIKGLRRDEIIDCAMKMSRLENSFSNSGLFDLFLETFDK